MAFVWSFLLCGNAESVYIIFRYILGMFSRGAVHLTSFHIAHTVTSLLALLIKHEPKELQVCGRGTCLSSDLMGSQSTGRKSSTCHS